MGEQGSSIEALLVRIFNECQKPQASLRRQLKELINCRRQHSLDEFAGTFKRFLCPVLGVMKREPALERLVKFVSSVISFRDEDAAECELFLEDLVKFLLSAIDAANKSVRYRSCQILCEVILLLPEDAEVSQQIWDALSEAMQRRLLDKIAAIRVFAARSLCRLVSADLDNDPTIKSQFQLSLSSDPNPEVRKALLLGIPVSNETVSEIVDRTRDVCAAVRKAAFSVIAEKLPVETLSIRQRALVLERGLRDRDPKVQAECRRMLKVGWLFRDCEKDVLKFLRFIDVETNEKVGELVMQELLRADCVVIDNSLNLRDYMVDGNIRLMEPEEALYWRTLCEYLHSEAEARSFDAAKTRGAEADVHGALAADKTHLLDSILPATVADFVVLVEAHHKNGPSHSFQSRQLLMLANVFDYSDSASRKCAASSIHSFLYQSASPENGFDLTLDGIYLGGRKEWSDAFVRLAKKVHASPGAFEEAIGQAALDLAKPCREGGASALQWLQYLALTGVLLENIKSIREFPAHLVGTQEMVDGLLLPAANHLVAEVQRAGVRCLSLYCVLEEHPSARIIYKLEEALSSGSGAVKITAVKGLFDLVMARGPELVDEQRNSLGSAMQEQGRRLPLLQLLANVLGDQHDLYVQDDLGETESARSVAAEGFAKLLMRRRLFREMTLVRTNVLSELFRMYFDDVSRDITRLGQCLSVFFHNYASASAENKHCIVEVFIPLIREQSPGITGKCHPHAAASRKKTAMRFMRFMLELLNQPLISQTRTEALDYVDQGQELLALRLAREIVRFTAKKNPSFKAYKSALCHVLLSLKFVASSRQEAIKAMRTLLPLVMNAMNGEKTLLKELECLSAELKSLDSNKEEVLGTDELEHLLASQGISSEAPAEAPPPKTPAARKPKKRAAPAISSDSSESGVQTPPNVAATPAIGRSQRASKTVAMERMQSIRATAKSKAIDFESEASETTLDEEVASSCSSDGQTQ